MNQKEAEKIADVLSASDQNPGLFDFIRVGAYAYHAMFCLAPSTLVESMAESRLLHCPIRGSLRVSQRAADGLTFTEEKQRIDALRYLIQQGYPKDHFGIETILFKLGNSGRNSFRTDFAIYDQPFADLKRLSVEERLDHLKLIAEIKRDNTNAAQAKATQVRAALLLVPDTRTLGIYWDDVEQRFLYRRIEGRKSVIHEASISRLPRWGHRVGSLSLSYKDLRPAKDMVKIFDDIEDAFHVYVVDKVERYTLIQQLLLLKIHDETTHRKGKRQTAPLDFQDYTAEDEITDKEVLRRMNAALASAAENYNKYLPEGKKIEAAFRCSAEVLRNASKILAPVNILGSKVQVVQQFYMKFAKSLYKWDLAQYFTPHEIIDFIVELANPRQGEHVFDPACGSADFLISAFRRTGSSSSEVCVWGADNSEQAVQISILNMVMNGDGKTQIKHRDSLESYGPHSETFSVVLCNPPFGTKIRERREDVLKKFAMGHKWQRDGARVSKTEVILGSQQTGILFAELCLRLTKPGGRVGIILPNGYLGNRTVEYVALREWLLCHGRIVAIVAFPRFTFKKSGADVSASVLLIERRATPLVKSSDDVDYAFFAGNIESVGWRAGDKAAVPIYKRDQMNGDLILDDDNEPRLDADFDDTLTDFLHSPSVDCFPWTAEDRDIIPSKQIEGIDMLEIVNRPDLNLDPKRHSSKLRELRRSIASREHFSLGEL